VYGKREHLEDKIKQTNRNLVGQQASGWAKHNKPMYERGQQSVLDAANELRRMGVKRGKDQPRQAAPRGPKRGAHFSSLSQMYGQKAQ